MKKTLLVFAMLLFGLSAMAKPVDQATAARVATNFMHLNGFDFQLTDVTNQSPFTQFYIFTAEKGGFVLISADDCVMPVLAFSTTSVFDVKQLPENVQNVLEMYEEEIGYWTSRDVQQTNVDWQYLQTGMLATPPSLTAVAPLVATQWGQDPLYNNLCPYDNNYNERTVTGCVATATAQIMKKWNFPATGYGNHSYVATNYYSNYGTLSANFGNTTYQWSNMPNSLTSSSSTAQVNAVATLMYHIGVADEMEYDISSHGGSSAANYNGVGFIDVTSETALQRYFKYRSDMSVVAREDYSNTEWINLLKGDLNAGRPILFSGRDNSGGHSFVCDGYNNSNLFHINWGWQGYYDGYFAMGALNPDGGGTGSNAGTYNMSNVAILRIQPNNNWSSTGTTVVTATAVGGTGCTVNGGGSYAFGDTIQLEAVAALGYHFTGWSDGCKFNPRQMLANGGSLSFTAQFEALGGDTITYCPGNRYITSIGAYGTTYWGIRIPSSALSTNNPLTAVQFYATEMGSHTLTVYCGTTSPSTTLYTTTFSVGSYGWQTVAVGNGNVPEGNDLWVVFSSDEDFPAAMSYSGGHSYSRIWGSNFGYAYYSQCSFMIRALFNTNDVPVPPTPPVSDTNCVVSVFPYAMGFGSSEMTHFNNCWTVYDADGDGYTWTTEEVAGAIASASYINEVGVLTPDNWLVTPKMHFTSGNNYTLSWTTTAVDVNYYNEHYGVYVSTTDSAVSSFTSVQQYTISSPSTTTMTLDLSTYAGQDVFIAFRHWNCSDVYWMLFDNVTVTETENPNPGQTYTITVQSADPTMGTVSGGGTYNTGSAITITATANDGYHFTQWNDGNANAIRNITVTANATYIAYFEADAPNPPTPPEEECFITSFPYTENFDDTSTYSCLSLWDVNQDGNSWGLIDSFGTNYSIAAFIMFAVNADDLLILPGIVTPGTYTVSWKAKIYHSSYPETYQVYAGLDSMIYTETLTSTSFVTRTATFTVNAGDTVNIIFRYISNDMYAFFLDDITISQSTPPAQYTITATSNNAAWGTVTGGGTYNEGTNVTLTATPADGYHFTQWNDGNTNATRTITVTANATYTAFFEVNAPNQYTITVQSADPTMGTVSGGGTYNAGTSVTISATANSGYHFTQWNDGNTNATRTITVTGDATYIASFEADANPQDECIITAFPWSENFEDINTLGCWGINDADGDGNSWFHYGDGNQSLGHNSHYAVASASWMQNVGPLTPDNWLVTPGFALPANQQLYLKWYEKGQDVNDFAENYSVYVSTTGDAITDFTTVVYSGTTVNSWQQQSVNLSAYAGQTIYVAFRHHNTTDMFYLVIDDVEISVGTPQPSQYTLTVLSNNDNWGNTTGSGTYAAGSTATIKALPYSGYRFVQWQDGNTDATRNVTVNADATYIATFAPTQGIDDVDGESLTLYPNPATDKVTVVGIEQAEVTVTDIAGRTVLVRTFVDGNNIIDVSSLAPGTYFVRIAADGDTAVRKLIVR